MLHRHWHWTVVAFDGSDAPGEKIHWAVEVSLIGYMSEADAKIAAEDIITRDNYRVQRVWECASCGFQQATSDNFKEMIKAIKD